jgi:ABC-2 type transport system permease protein
MATNSVLIEVRDRGNFNGFGNLFRKENHAWWRTSQWLIQVAIWMFIINGMLAMLVLAAPKVKAVQDRQKINNPQAAVAESTIEQTALMAFFLFSGLAPAVGVVILAQDALIGEKQAGTAAWVLSKPVSRVGFLLSKLSADGLGILITMVIVQGIVAYFIYKAGTGINLSIPGFLTALSLVALLLAFYLSLTYMLGSLFRKRGAVIGIPMILIFGNNLNNLIPWLGKFMPWNLIMDLGPNRPALAVAKAQGLPLPTLTPIFGTAIMTILFIAVAVWRFQREEF